MLQVNFTPFPILETARLRLRNVAPSDAPELFFLRSDKTVMQFLDRAPTASVEEATQLIKTMNDMEATNDAVSWAIALKEEDRMIGTISYWRIEKPHYRAEVGYLLHPAHHGKGLMQEALEVVLHYGFGVMHLHSVEANVNPGNTASIKLLERNGFVREGYFRENYYYNGKFLDSAIYSLLAPAT